MNQPEDELKRALRTAMRSIEAAKTAVLMEDAHRYLAEALHQLAFVVGKLVDERAGQSVTDTGNA